MYIRIGAFVAGLALIFAAAALAGDMIGPEPPADEDEMAADHGAEPAAHSEGGDEVPGLASTRDGLRLRIDRSRYEPGSDERVGFTVLGEDGEPYAEYEVEHEREMHLILVRRDLEGFQHLHPRQAPTGRGPPQAAPAPGRLPRLRRLRDPRNR